MFISLYFNYCVFVSLIKVLWFLNRIMKSVDKPLIANNFSMVQPPVELFVVVKIIAGFYVTNSAFIFSSCDIRFVL